MSRNTVEGDLIVAPTGAILSYVTTSASAPTTSDTAVPVLGQILATSSGGSTGAIYHWNGAAWVDTGATVAHLYGKST